MPKDFPTLDEVLETAEPPISINYQKTKDRRCTIDAKRNRIQDKFLDDEKGKAGAFRKTTRDYHVDKEHMKLLHGAPIGRYNPSYDRVWSKAPQIQIAGVKDRFGYGSKFSPNYVKPAEGQASAAGGNYYKKVERSFSNTGNPGHFKTMPSSRDAKNKTTVQFNRGLSNSESQELFKDSNPNDTSKSNHKGASVTIALPNQGSRNANISQSETISQNKFRRNNSYKTLSISNSRR